MKSVFFFFIFFATLTTSCSHQSRETASPSADQPALLLISLDGFRHDYVDHFKPPFLSKFKQDSLQADSLIPVFPSKTFPNHLSIVTGRYPDGHGIVGNSFYDPLLRRTYQIRDASAVTDGVFYLSEPLWNLVERNGLKSATMFWPGSEAKIQGLRPSYWRKYQHDLSHEKRVEQILEWLKLPINKRPQFLTVYFSDVDSKGHNFGPRSPEVKEAVMMVDEALKHLVTKAREINPHLNVIILSDHGMAQLEEKKMIYLDSLFSATENRNLLDLFKVVGSGPTVAFTYDGPAIMRLSAIAKLQKILAHKKSHGMYEVYQREKIPRSYHYGKLPRVGDLYLIAKAPYSVGFTYNMKFIPGNHGYSPFTGKDMHGIFYAQGPRIKPKKRIPSFQNIHLYPFMAQILGIKSWKKIDGNPGILSPYIMTQD